MSAKLFVKLPARRLLFLFSVLFCSGAFFSCLKTVYFVTDPYWETVTNVDFFQVQRMGLSSGHLVRIIETTQDTPWLDPEDLVAEDSADVVSLKVRMEGFLADGHKILLSPYWLRYLEEEPPEFSRGQLVLIDGVSKNPKVQSVIADLELGYRELGQIAGDYVLKHPEREQVIAMFYRGISYDKYLDSFTEGFREKNQDSYSLVRQRYYSAEVNEMNTALEEVDPAKNVIVLGMSQLSDLVYRQLSTEEKSLFMVENFGGVKDSKGQILVSLDVNYRLLVKDALTLAPLQDAEQSDEVRITRRPHVLHLPSPEMLLDIEQVQDLVTLTLEKREREYNRLDHRISRGWEKAAEFFFDFRMPDIPWPAWLRSWLNT
ncbi:hypothetical protein P0082_00780 [Candidatus Haliotispira prima]|uniref:Uncharacterized protein n=1 Tax=Candidatus Haliotispira prima TaxID=3034016 RepID=A0ABY8MHB8_9SPIO|nr:hypothetical protein P0082_00780 [Candidatus Haliotispira prima]